MERQPKDCQVGKTDVGKMFFRPKDEAPFSLIRFNIELVEETVLFLSVTVTDF
jgi:hypothetical protein